MPDFFDINTKLTIVNDALYEALKDYSLAQLRRDGIGVNRFVEESDSIGYRELSFEYCFQDDWTRCQPEGIYDVLPCLLIFLGVTLEWKPDQFAEFRKGILEKAADIERGFVRVHWATNIYSWRPDFDGTYETTEVFSYDMAEDVARFSKETLRYCVEEYKSHGKYHDFDWKSLDEYPRIL